MTAPTDIFKTPAARERMEAHYERFLARLSPPIDRTTIPTRHGDTNVLTFGSADAPPLLCLHGALAGAPHAVYEIRGLLSQFRIIAPDIVGQSVKSAPVRPAFDATGFGGWTEDVMDGLELSRAHVLGVSWGGAVALQMAIHAPQRIDRLALLVPGAMVSGSAWKAMVEVGWPMLRWRLRPTRSNLESLLRANLTTLDPLWVDFMGDAFRDVKIDFSAPPLVKTSDLEGFDRPTMVIGAEHDLSFPGAALLQRAKEVFGSALTQSHLIEGSKHCPPFDEQFRGWLCDRLRQFLDEPHDVDQPRNTDQSRDRASRRA